MPTRLLIFASLVVLFFESCASGNISGHKIKEPSKIYNNVAIVWTKSGKDIIKLDDETYNESFRGEFNNLDGAKYRRQLEKTFSKNMFPTKGIAAGDLFDINKDYDYKEFIDTIKTSGAEAILVIKRVSWEQKQHINGIDGDINTRYEPNARFHIYFIDMATLENQWIATSSIDGDFYASYGTVNNNLARKVIRKLRKERYIANKELKRVMSN